MTFRRRFLALCAFFTLSAAMLAGCGSNVPGNSVANVAGNPISLAAFNHWMYIASKGQASSQPGAPLVVPTDPPDFPSCVSEIRKQVPSLAKLSEKQLRATCKQLFGSLSTQVLDFLIRAYWYQALAAKEHVTVSDAAVMKAFNGDKASQFGGSEAKFQAFLTASGQTVQDVLYRVRANLIYGKLVDKETKPVTPAEISAYYAAHSAQFGTPETRDLRIVLTKTKSSADAAKSALSHGQSWTTVAKKYSIDSATKDKGGQLTNITQGQEDQALDKVAFSAPVGKLQGPVQSPFGYYLVEVTKINKATQESLAKAHAAISASLTQIAKQAAAASVDNRARKNYQHQTFCRTPSYTMNDCSGYKAPKGTSSTGTTG